MSKSDDRRLSDVRWYAYGAVVINVCAITLLVVAYSVRLASGILLAAALMGAGDTYSACRILWLTRHRR